MILIPQLASGRCSTYILLVAIVLVQLFYVVKLESDELDSLTISKVIEPETKENAHKGITSKKCTLDKKSIKACCKFDLGFMSGNKRLSKHCGQNKHQLPTCCNWRYNRSSRSNGVVVGKMNAVTDLVECVSQIVKAVVNSNSPNDLKIPNICCRLPLMKLIPGCSQVTEGVFWRGDDDEGGSMGPKKNIKPKSESTWKPDEIPNEERD